MKIYHILPIIGAVLLLISGHTQLALIVSALLAAVFLLSYTSTEDIPQIAKRSIQSLRDFIADRKASDFGGTVSKKGYSKSLIIHSENMGYITAIDWKLLKKLRLDEWEVVLHKSTGDFVQQGMELMTFWSNQEVAPFQFQKIFKFSLRRSDAQDPFYGIHKLRDLAMKSLSPLGLNITVTIEAVNFMTSVLLEFLKGLPMKEAIYLEEKKVLRLPVPDFAMILDHSLDPLLSEAKKHAEVIESLRQNLYFMLEIAENPELQKVIKQKLSTL